MVMCIMTVMRRGVPTVELEEWTSSEIGKTKETGTCINFLPDPEIFEKTRFSARGCKEPSA